LAERDERHAHARMLRGRFERVAASGLWREFSQS
jgi:hypothetical protein